MPPSKYRHQDARNQENCLEAHFDPVSDRRGISVSHPIRSAKPIEKPVQIIRIEVRDFSLGKAIPKFADAIDAQINCDDAGENFIKKKLHSNTRSSSTHSMQAAR